MSAAMAELRRSMSGVGAARSGTMSSEARQPRPLPAGCGIRLVWRTTHGPLRHLAAVPPVSEKLMTYHEKLFRMNMVDPYLTTILWFDKAPDLTTVADAFEKHLWPCHRFNSCIEGRQRLGRRGPRRLGEKLERESH